VRLGRSSNSRYTLIPRPLCNVNGEVADSERVLRDGDKLEFIKASGAKGLYGGPGPAGDLRVGAEFLEGVRRARLDQPLPATVPSGYALRRASRRAPDRRPAGQRIGPENRTSTLLIGKTSHDLPCIQVCLSSTTSFPSFCCQRRAIGEIAKLLGVSRQTLHRVMAGRSSVTPEIAVRLGKLCGNGPGLWLSLQARYDGWEATERLGEELKNIPTLRD
jgi:addiction module HigA family antidote